MPAKSVFVSFDYDNDLRYKNMLLAWDKNRQFDFGFYDGSLTAPINSNDATYIKSKIRPKIQAASHLLCIVGAQSSKSSWIDWEITTANQMGKFLIGLKNIIYQHQPCTFAQPER